MLLPCSVFWWTCRAGKKLTAGQARTLISPLIHPIPTALFPEPSDPQPGWLSATLTTKKRRNLLTFGSPSGAGLDID